MKRIKQILIVILSSSYIMTQASNPFLIKPETPFETVPFDKIEIGHYEPAFDEAMKLHNQEIEAITHNPQSPTFVTLGPFLARSQPEQTHQLRARSRAFAQALAGRQDWSSAGQADGQPQPDQLSNERDTWRAEGRCCRPEHCDAQAATKEIRKGLPNWREME